VNFLFPLYLAGAAAVALPIYLHLRRRPPKDAIEFSSLMFLEPTEHQPLKRRSQLENIALLILRCLALLFLAAMFSRPFLAGGSKEGAAAQMRRVILLDLSASMQRGGLWEQAVELAQQASSELGPDGSLGIISLGQSPRTLLSFDDWRNTDPARRVEMARRVIEAAAPGWGGSDLGSGLMAAAEMVADAASTEDGGELPSEIVLISDLQSGADLDAVAEASWPDAVSVVLAPVEVPETDNATLLAAASPDPKRPLVRVRNAPDSGLNSFEIRAGAERISATVPPGESRLFQLESPASEIVLGGDGEGQEFDNRLFLAPLEAATVNLQFIGDGRPDDSNGPEYYFRRAFGLSEVLQPRFIDDLDEKPEILAIARALDPDEISSVRALLDEGGHALLIVSDPNMATTFAGLTGIGTPSLREHDGDYALLERIDFDHPALGEFRDPRWRDFTEVHFWRHREIDPADLPDGSKVIARFDSGAPAWIEVPVGDGALLVMMSGWHPRDSQLSLSTKFVPLLFSLFSDAGPKVGGVRQFFVGEPLPLGDGAATLVLPSGESQSLAAGERFLPDAPGIYRAGGGRAFAVNLKPSESELVPLGKEPLLALGVPIDKPADAGADARDERVLRKQESEAAQNLWRWAVLALLGLLVAETWIGARSNTVQPALEPSA
jgi:hypothetical protein